MLWAVKPPSPVGDSDKERHLTSIRDRSCFCSSSQLTRAFGRVAISLLPLRTSYVLAHSAAMVCRYADADGLAWPARVVRRGIQATCGSDIRRAIFSQRQCRFNRPAIKPCRFSDVVAIVSCILALGVGPARCRGDPELANTIAALMSPTDLLAGTFTGVQPSQNAIEMPDRHPRRQLSLSDSFSRSVRARTA